MLSFWRTGTNYSCPQLRLNSRHTVGLQKGQNEYQSPVPSPVSLDQKEYMNRKQCPHLTGASKFQTRADHSWDFIGPVAMTTRALSSFFTQNSQMSPDKISVSHKWASILTPRQDLNWTSNNNSKKSTQTSLRCWTLNQCLMLFFEGKHK